MGIVESRMDRELHMSFLQRVIVVHSRCYLLMEKMPLLFLV